MKTRIFFSFLILFLVASCAHMEPPLQHEAATPGLLIEEQKPLSSSQAERENVALEQDAGQVKSPEDHKRLLEAKQKDFNKLYLPILISIYYVGNSSMKHIR